VVDPETAAAHRELGMTEYYFCGAGCASTFDDEPERYASGATTA
jgi:Cu+-exporting ATPase